ncbi:EthD family reductase [Spirosoma agri]|jgi:uncharacterized protein (TIGR02118 family)|uniref:EthD family reductase n=1 Tax=Spirosoma agri TaxID=1987381 RepID=A0A6M0IFW3_9BACT|nr:EthD family reductase [Spirosoma agri]NEU67169.1 EthD family reductase [Spirosoma agri]
MVRLTVLYPKTKGTTFNRAYYLESHIPLVKKRLTPFGLQGIDLQEGLSGNEPGSLPAYAMITGLRFNTTDELNRGLNEHGAELIGDIANFTDAQPLMQVSQDL